MLGSLPGRRSLQAGQYYAHPRNAFWRIIAELLGVHGSYTERCTALQDAGIAAWDVLAEAARPGSLDADICGSSARANDFQTFFAGHPRIVRVGFNGQAAAKLYRRLLPGSCRDAVAEYRVLPSTSPAHAAMPYTDKLAAWRDFLDA